MYKKEVWVDDFLISHLLFFIFLGMLMACHFLDVFGVCGELFKTKLEISFVVEICFSLFLMCFFELIFLVFVKSYSLKLKKIFYFITSLDGERDNKYSNIKEAEIFLILLLGSICFILFDEIYKLVSIERVLVILFFIVWGDFFVKYWNIFFKLKVLIKFLDKEYNSFDIKRKVLFFDKVLKFLPFLILELIMLVVVVLYRYVIFQSCSLILRTTWMKLIFIVLGINVFFLFILLFLFKKQFDKLIPLLENKKRVNEIMGKFEEVKKGVKE